jgi:hypothetical protein
MKIKLWFFKAVMFVSTRRRISKQGTRSGFNDDAKLDNWGIFAIIIFLNYKKV